nr:TM2 domain-containing protein [Paenibacillus caui]
MDYNVARKSQLDTRELLLLDSELKSRGKNMVVAYVLWYFLGLFGGHRFYLGLKGSAIAQLILSLTLIGMAVTGIWWIVDAFLTHTWVKEHNQKLENEILSQIEYERGHRPFNEY